MKILFPKQRESADRLVTSLLNTRGALDASLTGVGKTVIAAHVARELAVPVCVVCPKIVIPHWQRELAEVGISPIFITNYEKLRRGTAALAKVGKKMFRWALNPETLIIWDECHKCKSPFSQNAQMLVAARQAGMYNLLLSATACQDATEMRSIGYVLGLHGLNRAEGMLRSWFSWMLAHGCKKDPWNNWVAGPISQHKLINQRMYGPEGSCVKLTPADLPHAFADNHIIAEPLAFSALKDIAKFYAQHGVTPEIVESAINGTKGVEPHILVEILRARQLAEAAKVPDIIEMVKDAVAEGYSAAVFVNFKDTVAALAETFYDAAIIQGGQNGTDREVGIQKFQSNKTKVVICNIAAGGVGVSLHDIHGGHPRMSFISPTFNAKEYVQCLGRIHRAGAKTPSIQRILIASGTIEEKIVDTLERKRLALDTLHTSLP